MSLLGAAAITAGGSVLGGLLGGGGGDSSTKVKLDDFTKQYRHLLARPPGLGGQHHFHRDYVIPGELTFPSHDEALYNVWQLPQYGYGPEGLRIHQGASPAAASILGSLAGRAQPAPYEQGAARYADLATRGGYLGTNPAMGFLGEYAYGGPTNPWLDQAVQRAMGQAGSAVASRFGRGGMGGSSMEQQIAARELGGVASNMYGRAYETDMNRRLQAASVLGNLYGQERGLQQEAAFNVPSLLNMDLTRLSGALGGAQGLERYGQQQRAEELEAWRADREGAYRRLAAISQAMSGMPTGQTTTLSGPSSVLPNAVGGGLTALGLFGPQGQYPLFGGTTPPAPVGTVPYSTGVTPGTYSPVPGATMPSWGTGFGSYT